MENYDGAGQRVTGVSQWGDITVHYWAPKGVLRDGIAPVLWADVATVRAG